MRVCVQVCNGGGPVAAARTSNAAGDSCESRAERVRFILAGSGAARVAFS